MTTDLKWLAAFLAGLAVVVIVILANVRALRRELDEFKKGK